MTLAEKKSCVDAIPANGDIFDDLRDLPGEVLNFRPSPERWTIQEHLIHCLDVDLANFNRYRTGIVYPGTEIVGMDDAWTEKLKPESMPAGLAIDTIKLIRKLCRAHLSTIVEDDWTRYSILYKKYGVLDFEAFIPVFNRHPAAHREYIDRLLEEYGNRK